MPPRGIFLARLVLLAVGLFVASDAAQARLVLPPVEQAIDLATVLLLVWGVVIVAPDRPRLADTTIVVALALVAVMLLFFYQEWQSQAAGRVAVTYASTTQSFVWAILQLLVLGAGTIWLVLDKKSRLTLRPLILGVPLAAHVLQLWSIPQPAILFVEPAYWVRLGYLVAFPLWAVLAYRENVSNLVSANEAGEETAEQLTQSLDLATDVIAARILQIRLDESLDMVAGLVPSKFVAIGLTDLQNSQRVVFNHARPAPAKGGGQGWRLDLSERSALRLALEQQRGLELLPRGVGARQVHELAQQFNMGSLGPTFVEPLMSGGTCLGFLIVAADPSVSEWSAQERALVPSLAAFLSQAIANSRTVRDDRLQPDPVELVALEAEIERLTSELAATRRLLVAAEARVVTSADPPAQSAPVAAAAAHTHPQLAPTTPLLPALEAAVGSVLPVIRNKNLQVDLALSSEMPDVAVREEVLEQLLLSLLDNACRATAEESSLVVQADLVSANGGDSAGRPSLSIRVTDSGRGIRVEDRDRVFDSQFYMAGSDPIPGLGDNQTNLAVVRRLAQAMGGDVSLDSVVGEGTTFSLRLPVIEVGPPETAVYGPASSVEEPSVAG